MSNPLADLSRHGVSVWLDDLSRELLADGELQRLVDRFHVAGVTTNPTIFASALAKGDRYTDQVRGLARRGADVEAHNGRCGWAPAALSACHRSLAHRRSNSS